MSADPSPLRWGIAGPGGIGTSMARALATLPDAHLIAVGSRSAERAAAFAAEHGIDPAHAHGSYEALFADPDIDIIYVASPHSEHRAHTVTALTAGKHVLCEKAFAVNAAEAREMVATAGGTERFLMEAIWTWFLPTVIDIRERIAAGEIGEIRFVESTFSLNIPGPTGRHRELGLAGGALLDLGIYPVAFTRYLLGAPSEVRAIGQIGDTGVDVNVGGVLGHSSGAVSVFTTGLDAVSTLSATITGTAGIITVDAPFWCPTSFTVNRHDGAPEHVTLEHQGLAHEAAHAMARLREGHLESDVLPLATSISIMETLDEIRSQIGMVYPQD